MQIARCSLRCGSSNAFRPQQALRCLFFEQKLPLNFDNARRISTTHPKLQEEERPVVETPPADARIPSESSPIPPSEYIDTASLQGSLQTLRRKNRERLLGQEHASTDDPSPSGGQSKDAKVDDLLPERRWAINKATLPKTTDEPQPQARTNSYKAQKITKRKSKYNAVDPLEYTGMYVRPSIGEANPEQEYPWTKDIPDDLRGMARLDAEIWNFSEYIRPTPAEQATFKAVTEDVQKCAKEYCPDYETEAYGSQSSGLALSTSDIDIRLYDKEHKFSREAPRAKSRNEIFAHIKRLEHQFRFQNSDYIMVRIRQARYPLLSMLHKKTGLDIQIVASNDTSYSNNLIQQYLVDYPYLYANYALIRSLFEIRGLTDVYRGGLGSYSLIMMIMAVIKSKGVTVSGEQGHIRAGGLLAAKRLLDVLQFYAGLDTYETALSLEHPFKVNKHDKLDVSEKQRAEFAEASHLEFLNKLALIDHMQPYLLCLQDPADPLNDLGRKGYGWKHIQTTIKVLRGVITKTMSSSVQQNSKDLKAPAQSIIARAVGPCFKAYEARRAITEAYGQEILDKERAAKEKAVRAADKKAVEAESADI
ncbi:hypothetical protein EG328_007460 [Venturia inaequalis]|uniref:Poly(A) RNA polymerase mitochondrial-like central palm domain-containing protein n=1 Tax=Venturia inaequalis TaxID=5025 RepID=A0A8H3VST2_VENIN|nr:hypothetical protein EG328_007460 [Venturia inaequalis]KAE9994754.1 hypothetical protein EG327_003018 [Venturia inaequalis]RDI81840.1 hypothetical protein Vi05172_g8291 [Venturia inaequalis]